MKKRRLVLRPEACQELEQAVAWYEVRLPDLRDQFRAEVHRALDNVIARPELYGKFRGATRKAVLGCFACLIFYLVEAGQIVVFAVFPCQAQSIRPHNPFLNMDFARILHADTSTLPTFVYIFSC